MQAMKTVRLTSSADSCFILYENAANPLINRRNEIQKWKALAHAVAVESPEILTLMRNNIKIGCKPLDALHLACPMTLGCDCF